MLSGALLLQPSKVNEPIRVFLRKRLSRLGLAYLFWSVVYLAWGFFVTQVPVTLSNITEGLVKGLFTGPYYHFWFLYLIAGLYLITPILRAVIAHGDPKILRYLIVLWFLGVAVVPILQLIVGYGLYSSVFVLGGWIGYFVLGVYVQKMQVRSSVLYVLLFLGLVWTVVGTWFMTFLFSPLGQYYFFLDYLTANVIVASVCLFLILSRFPADWPGTNHPHASRVVRAVSKNVLPIYLLHVIILESLQKGYFGFKLSLTTLNPIVGVPVIAVVVFFVTFGLVLLLKRVPVLKKLIG